MTAKIVFILFLILHPTKASADAGVFSCLAKNEKTSAQIQMDEIGKVTLILSGNLKATCKLAIQSFEYAPRAQAPGMRLSLKRANCTPALSASDQTIFTRSIYLNVKWTSAKGPLQGRVQWLKKEEPGECKVTKFSSEDLERLSGKWKLGLIL